MNSYEQMRKVASSILSVLTDISAKPRKLTVQYLLTTLALILVTWLGHQINFFVGYRTIGFLFLLTILGLSLLFSLGPIVFSAIGSAIIWNFFFIPPVFNLSIAAPDDLMLCLSYLVVAVITGVLTGRIKRREQVLQEREARTQFLYHTTKSISENSNREIYLKQIVARLSGLLNLQCCLVLADEFGVINFENNYAEGFLFSESERYLAAQAFGDCSSAADRSDSILFVRVAIHQNKFGLLCLRRNSGQQLSLDEVNLLETICQQLALSFERELLDSKSKTADLLRESEALHQALMNSVSHELRTPLTTIVGMATSLADPAFPENSLLRQELTKELVKASHRLNRVVENLLDLTRLNSGMLSLSKDWFALDELIQMTVQRLCNDLHEHEVIFEVDEVSLVRIDFRLLEQVLSNILLNAVAYTPVQTTIFIKLWQEGSWAYIRVRDQGDGVAAEALPKLFDKFFRGPGVPTGGTGLGLYIAKSFVDAHGGEISVRNSELGGAEFEIKLPVEPVPNMLEVQV